MAIVAERIARYREILQKDPQSRIYVPLADLLQQTGELEEALLILERGLSRNPGHQAAMVVLGRTLLQAGRQDHGEKVLQRVLELSPDNFVVLRVLAENFMRYDAFSHALPLLERLVEIEPEQMEWPKLLADARDRLAEVSRKAQISEKSSDSEETGENNGKALATMTLVDILVAQGYVDKAMAALKQMQERDPARQDVFERLAQLKSGLTKPDESSSAKNDASAIDLPAGEARIKMRESQKKQFGEWIDNFKTEGDSPT